MRDDAVEGWLRAHPEAADAYLLPELEAGRADWVRRSRWPALVRDVAAAFVDEVRVEDAVVIDEGEAVDVGILGDGAG